MSDVRFGDFMKALVIEDGLLNGDLKETENGAIGYTTTGKNLVDFNFKVSSFRHASEAEIMEEFDKIYEENTLHAILFLFFARDVRGGLGERRLFRVCLNRLIEKHPDVAIMLLDKIPEYGRWDDLIEVIFFDYLNENEMVKDVKDNAITIIKNQLISDIQNCKDGKPISLLAKWMPRVNTSSNETKARGKFLAKLLFSNEKEYRKCISSLNKYLKTIEVSMSSNDWDKIDYEAVPSKANLNYKDAFMKHDEIRRSGYLESLKSGEVKINSGTLYPHEIVSRYRTGNAWSRGIKAMDDTLEQLWKALPDTVQGRGNVIVVQDGSGSMMTNISNGTTALDVSQALAIYFAEKMTPPLKNTFITFSSHPTLVRMEGDTLWQKLKICDANDDCSNTNIEATFDLLLNVVTRFNIPENEIPDVLIISDMEFDAARAKRSYYEYDTTTLFNCIRAKWEQNGHKLPRLIFWNVNSRTNAIPVRENENGVTLVSGFSTMVADIIFSGKLDPAEILLDTLYGDRYKPIYDRVFMYLSTLPAFKKR